MPVDVFKFSYMFWYLTEQALGEVLPQVDTSI